MITNKRYIQVVSSMMALLSILIANDFAQAKSWTSVREAKWRADFSDIYFVDTQHGWIVGSNSTILHTNNSGMTWEKQPSQPLPFKVDFYKVRFINTLTGWIVGDAGTVLKTTDGGATWMKLNSGTRAALSAISFVDDRFGWAGGDGGLVIHTADGGHHLVPTENRHK